MTLNDYQDAAGQFARYPTDDGLFYTALALNEEAGEVAGKVAKWVRAGRGYLDKDAVAKEVGDCLWQVARVAHELGYSLEDIATMNLDKLYARSLAGTIVGEGDNR